MFPVQFSHQYVLLYPDQTFQQMSERLMRTHQDKLHQSRKLVLMVDLDNTLIHTTEMPCQCSPKKVLYASHIRKWDLRQCCGLALE